MRKLIVLFAASVILFACTGEKENRINNSLTNLKLIGEVKSLTESTFKAVDEFGKIKNGDLNTREISSFNEKGIINNRIYYNSYGNNTDKAIDKFDSTGKELERIWYKADGSISPDDGKIIFEYDKNGNKEQYQYETDGSFKLEYSYKYDKNKNLIESNWYGVDGSLLMKTIYKYDSSYNLIELSTNNIDSEILNYKETYNYDEKGLVIEENKVDAMGNYKVTYKYNFDEIGNWIKKTQFSDNVPMNITEREIIYY